MVKCIILLWLVSVLLFLSACNSGNAPVETGSTTKPEESIITPVQTTETVDVTVSTEPSLPVHSALYIPDIPVADVICYFNEVCLHSEIINSGDPSVVQKWTIPICYTLEGEYTQADMETLNAFESWLNSMEGFPGMSYTQDSMKANLRIHFCDQEGMLILMGEEFNDVDGAVTFWYHDDRIDNAIICYRTDITQHVRNSVILEEIYNGLGPIQDTDLREDSIVYAGFSEPQWLSPIDELIIRLLYHPDIRPGMDAQACEQVIRSLYY